MLPAITKIIKMKSFVVFISISFEISDKITAKTLRKLPCQASAGFCPYNFFIPLLIFNILTKNGIRFCPYDFCHKRPKNKANRFRNWPFFVIFPQLFSDGQSSKQSSQCPQGRRRISIPSQTSPQQFPCRHPQHDTHTSLHQGSACPR